MPYEQLKQPNLDPVVYYEGKVLYDWYGYCLDCTETAFGTPHNAPTAWAAWGDTQYRHEDRNFPVGVYFPIWFSGYNGEGHVALAFVNSNGQMGIWTSPYEHVPYFYTGYHSVDALAEGYKVSYAGWTEDIGGVRVIQPKPQSTAEPAFTATITPITPKKVLVKDGMHEWNLALANFADVCNNPITTVGPNTLVTVSAQLTRSDFPQYTYLLPDASKPIGYNTLDVTDHAPPVATAPYTPPAAPVTVVKAETYTLVTALPYYANPDDCQKRQNSTGTLPATTYYVWQKAGTNSIYYDLTTDNTKDQAKWVNVLDNKAQAVVVTQSMEPSITATAVPMTPPPMTESEIRATYRDVPGGPIEVMAKQNLAVFDIVQRGKQMTIPKGTVFNIYGTFRNGKQWYAMPKLKLTDKSSSDYMYGVPIASQNTLDPFLETAYGIPEQLQVWYDKAISTIEGVFRPRKK